MYQDLHSHTYYSFCGKDAPEAVVEAAIAGGLELFGLAYRDDTRALKQADFAC